MYSKNYKNKNFSKWRERLAIVIFIILTYQLNIPWILLAIDIIIALVASFVLVDLVYESIKVFKYIKNKKEKRK